MGQAPAFTIGMAALTIGNMAARPKPLDLRVLRKGRREDEFQATGDPKDSAWLQSQLQGWLTGKKWHPARWGEFELEARPAGEWVSAVAKVRA